MKALFWLLIVGSCIGIIAGIVMMLHNMCGLSVCASIFVTISIYIVSILMFLLVLYFEDMYYNNRKNGVDKGKKM